MSKIVAERILQKSGSSVWVAARIYAPEKIAHSTEWSCRIEVQGLGDPWEKSIIGVDSFQALYSALRVLCAHIERYEQSLTFLDGEEGDAGLPLIIPWDFGASLKTEIYQLINKKISESFAEDS